MGRDLEARQRKRSLRRVIVAAILEIDPRERRAQESALFERFTDLPGLAGAATVLLYVKAFPEELDTRLYFRYALDRGLRVACPRVDRQAHCLRLARIRDPHNDLEPGVLSIPEPRIDCTSIDPQEVDWVLVPGLGFDRRCYRLGRGAGYYDRLLPTLRPDVERWSLGFDCQLIDELPVEPHDVPVDGLATPSAVIRRA